MHRTRIPVKIPPPPKSNMSDWITLRCCMCMWCSYLEFLIWWNRAALKMVLNFNILHNRDYTVQQCVTHVLFNFKTTLWAPGKFEFQEHFGLTIKWGGGGGDKPELYYLQVHPSSFACFIPHHFSSQSYRFRNLKVPRIHRCPSMSVEKLSAVHPGKSFELQHCSEETQCSL